MERALRAVSIERGWTPGAWRWSPSAGPARCTPARWPRRWACPRWWSRPGGRAVRRGLLTAPRRRDLVRSWPTRPTTPAWTRPRPLADEARALVGDGGRRGGRVEVALDCRYRGQSHELTVPGVDEFHDEHRRRNGYARPEDPVEVVALRAVATRPPEVRRRRARPARPSRRPRPGPAVIAEPDCTIWVPEGWVARPGAAGAWSCAGRSRRCPRPASSWWRGARPQRLSMTIGPLQRVELRTSVDTDKRRPSNRASRRPRGRRTERRSRAATARAFVETPPGQGPGRAGRRSDQCRPARGHGSALRGGVSSGSTASRPVAQAHQCLPLRAASSPRASSWRLSEGEAAPV